MSELNLTKKEAKYLFECLSGEAEKLGDTILDEIGDEGEIIGESLEITEKILEKLQKIT